MNTVFDKENRSINRLTVHAGTFHSDDVFCGAVARIINPEVTIERVAKSEADSDVEAGNVVADIGRGMFDHHQEDCPYREDGIKHCGASRVWLFYGVSAVKKVCPDITEEAAVYAAEKVYNNMLRTIAALDNGDINFPNNIYSIVNVVEVFRPRWNEDKTFDEGYMEAVDYIKLVLEKEIKRHVAVYEAADYVKERIEEMEDGVVVLDKYLPWKEPVMAEKAAKAVVYPSLRVGWNVEPVPENREESTYRVHVPDAWRGVAGDEAEHQMKGMTFCHMQGFIMAFDTKEHAIEGAKYLSMNC